MKLFTEVQCPELPFKLSLNDKIMMLGSCFSDNIGRKLQSAGFDVCLNPFGTLYNPLSVLESLRRLDSGRPFGPEDCVQMGAGAGKVCSFSHHTSFARAGQEVFLSEANAELTRCVRLWRESAKLIVTFGTAFVWRHVASGRVVANCLKRPASEFRRELMTVGEVRAAVQEILAVAAGRDVIFTVSPIRHLGQGAHQNTVSKATLQLGIGPECCYFPSYEIMLDQLRDYRFYADNDLCHPSALAVDVIWEKFRAAAIPESEWQRIAENEKAAARAAHRSILI